MRCYCCDRILSDDAPIDSPTGRYYCAVCFEPTIDIQLADMKAEIAWEMMNAKALNTPIDILDDNLLEEDIEQIMIEENYIDPYEGELEDV